uniref:Multicopper oxidase n=1 Tax=Globodera pallida TaxID=36090 RepID=A0A183C1D5_GLOPA
MFKVSNGWNFWEGQLEMARPNEDGIYEFDFLIEHALTMTTLQKDKITPIIDYSPDELFWTKRDSDFHSKCNKNETILNGTEKIEKMDHLLSTLLQWDGKHQKVITINGKSPGDPIVVPLGAKVIIRIRNHLFTQAITLHMHGMKMQNRWWNDGVPYIQQCPISPGSVYTYNFIADSPGTHWYHASKCGTSQGTRSILGISSSDKPSRLPLTNFAMKKGKNMLLRLANGAFEESFYIWIEEHQFWIVAADGSYVRPKQFDSLLIHPGERYDLLIVAQKNPQRNLFRMIFETFDRFMGNITTGEDRINVGLANLIYEGVQPKLSRPNTDDVDWNHKKCTKESNCAILNCPHIDFISRPLNYTCIAIDQLENAELPLSDDANIFESKNYSENQFSEMMLNSMPTFNRWFYKMPKELPFFNQGPLERIATKCDAKKCDRSKEDCHCFHHYEFRLGTIVQITAATSMNMLHPFHLHGTKFYVMKIGKMEPKYLLNPDIKCADKHCIEMKWSNISYYNGNVPLLKKNPTLRDTVMIPHMGYVMIRFRATNPGWFFAHCHLLFHHMNGMAFAFKVDVASGVSKIPKPPSNFPKNCGFYDGGEGWERDEDQQQNAMNYFLICLTGLSVLSNLDAFRQQSVGIRGRLMCGNQPLKNTQVKLWNKNTLGSDDQLSSFTTDNQGNFELQGGVGQMTKMNVHFKIYHDCDDGIKPCQRKVNFGVPDHYVERSAQTKKWSSSFRMRNAVASIEEMND